MSTHDIQLIIGQTVRLKSGGPLMTVKSFCRIGDTYRCVWFTRKFKLCEGYFTFEELSIINSDNIDK